MMVKKKILILGATSHIAKGLICGFARKNKYKLFLYARSFASVKDFLKANCLGEDFEFITLNDLTRRKYELIINCVGIGTPNKVKNNPCSVFEITEEYDKILEGYLSKFTDSRCVNFSSGAVYGGSFNAPVNDSSLLKMEVNSVNWQQYYGLAKVYSEAKHRAWEKLHIIDARIFSYFSRFIDLDSGYFLAELIKSILRKKEFLTGPRDFIRDYLHPSDLLVLLELFISGEPFNAAIDVYSKAPVGKFELLDYFSKNYGLKYEIDAKLDLECPTGEKDVYCSSSRKASKIGYCPRYTSLEAVAEEASFLLA